MVGNGRWDSQIEKERFVVLRSSNRSSDVSQTRILRAPHISWKSNKLNFFRNMAYHGLGWSHSLCVFGGAGRSLGIFLGRG